VTQENGPVQAKKRKGRLASLLNWPLVRKLESLVFMAMFLAMPLFAFRVIDYTARQLNLQNTAHDLVKDIRRVKIMAGKFDKDVTVEAKKSVFGKPASYVIRQDDHILEEIVLAKGVTMLGEVTFAPDGKPLSAATFELHTDTKSLSVDVEGDGTVSAP
jgi:hypothetical protein